MRLGQTKCKLEIRLWSGMLTRASNKLPEMQYGTYEQVPAGQLAPHTAEPVVVHILVMA